VLLPKAEAFVELNLDHQVIRHPLFTGAGGGGGGSDFTNTPDNLRSEDTFEGLMGMCAGPIKGPVDGLKGVILDGTPVINSTGQENFPGLIAIYSSGDPTLHPQLVNMRLGSASAPIPVNVAVSNTNTGSGTSTPGPFIARSVPNVGADYIDLRFIVQQLYRQSEKGIFTTDATLEIQLKRTGDSTWINPTIGDAGAWTGDPGGKSGGGIKGLFGISTVDQSSTNSKNFNIKGKTTSPTVVELRLWVPNEGAYTNVGWDIRVRLLQREDYTNDDEVEQRQIVWESLAAIYNDVIGEEEDWRALAWLQLYGKATDNLKGVPEVEVIAETKIVSVPPSGIFNPATRAYTASIWDGSWAKAYTNDPAWIINDAISDPISGLAKFAPGSHLNKWDALEASKWFSQMVPDGAGGTHPRYSLNVVHNQPMKAEDFIRYLAGSVGALAWDDGSGEWRMKVDKPESPVDIFTLENIEGEFTYSHTDVDTRFNDYRGTFLNQEFEFREETIGVVDNTSIALIGHKPTTVALIGCTNRQEALRRLMLRLRSSTRETRVVNFTTNRRADHLVPLDVILVADADLGDQEQRTTGRVTWMNGARTQLKVRDPIRLEVGVTYKLKFAKPNADYDPESLDQPTSAVWKNATVIDERTIANTAGQRGDVTDLYLSSALPTGTAEYLVVALEATGLTTLPKQYRILSLSKDDEEGERVTVSAVEIDTGKWAAADGVDAQDSVFTDLSKIAPKPLPPISGDIATLIATPGEQGLNHAIIVNWTRPLGALVDGFKVTYGINGGPHQVLAERTMIPTVDLTNPAHGTYDFKIYTITRTGFISLPLQDTVTVNKATLSAADLAYMDGQTLESLQPAAAGADPTGANVSAGIFGQGSLATQSYADYETQVTGSIPGQGGNELTDTLFGAKWTLTAGVTRTAQGATSGFGIGSKLWNIQLAPSTTLERRADGEKIPVVAGRKYFFSARVSRNSTLNTNAKLHLGGKWYAENGNTHVSDATEAPIQDTTTLTSGAIPAEVLWAQTAPAGAYFYEPHYWIPAASGAAGAFRIEDPRVSQTSPGADTSAWITYGPDSVTVNYDSTTGTVLDGQLPMDLDYKLAGSGGNFTSGVTWSYKVMNGTVNGFTVASGSQSLSATSGATTLTVSSIGSNTASIELSAVYNATTYKKTITLTKNFVTSTGGGGGGTMPVVKNTGFTSFNTTSFVDITGTMSGTMPAGKTSAQIAVNLAAKPSKTGGIGNWTVEMKVQRNISSVWTDQGATFSAASSVDSDDVLIAYDATISGNRTSSSLTAGVSYDWRIVARLTSGTRTHSVSGTVTISAP
jgi:predicted phage tail protein